MLARTRCTAVLSLSLVLAACGGGSSSSSTVTPVPATAKVAGVVGGTAGALTLAGQPLTVSGPVTVNGQSATAAAVKPGSVIIGAATLAARAMVAGAQAQNAVNASSVDVQVEIEGLVDSVDVAAGTLQVVGQTVTTDALTVIEQENPDGSFSSITLADITAGSFVEISGQRSASGGLAATRIELQPKAAGDPSLNDVEVRGTIAALDTTAKIFTLGTDTVDFSTATVTGTLADGARVEVQGTRSGTTIAATRVDVKAAETGEPGEGSELEGTVQQLDATAKTFLLMDFTVDYSAVTPAPTLADGSRVEVQGSFDQTNTKLVHATAIHVEHSHSGSGSADGEVKGQVSLVDGTAMTLTVGSTSLWADAQTVVEQNDQQAAFSQIQVGNWVEVRFDSTKLQSGASYATKIEITGQPASGGTVELEGAVASFNGATQTLELNGQSVAGGASTVYQIDDQTVHATTFWGTDRTGQNAQVKGTLSGQTVNAGRIELRKAHH